MIKKVKFNYEINCNDAGQVISCFKEAITIVIDEDGSILAHGRNKVVIPLDEMRSTVASMQEVPPAPSNIP